MLQLQPLRNMNLFTTFMSVMIAINSAIYNLLLLKCDILVAIATAVAAATFNSVRVLVLTLFLF